MMSINLNIIIFLWKHLQGPQILPQTEGVNLIMLAQVNDVCPLSSVLTNSKTPPLIVTDRNGSVFFNYSIDVNSVNVLNGHVHFNVQVKSQLKFLFSWNVLSVFVQQATSLLCCVFVCKCVCEQCLCKSAVCCYFAFAFCYPTPKKENASMACLLSPSKRAF